jgi:pimeloyl-ACP methyl ester carboxylesterase
MAAGRPDRTLVFAHANGFPAGTYRRVFEAWRAADWHVHAIDKVGHDPRFPITVNWPYLRDQLIHFIEQDVGQAAYLVGHSLGGYLSLLAAARRPDLAHGVVMLDSPIVGGWKARAIQFAQATGVGERFSPARVSKRRREYWDSAGAAQAHFAAKPAFARWAPGVLDDYIAHGTEPHGGGRRLAFRREIETAIYNTLPHHLTRRLRTHPLRCPLAFVRGSQSEEVRRVGLAATSRLAQGRISVVEGSHLFPMERPAETAAEVLRLLEAMRVGHL